MIVYKFALRPCKFVTIVITQHTHTDILYLGSSGVDVAVDISLTDTHNQWEAGECTALVPNTCNSSSRNTSIVKRDAWRMSENRHRFVHSDSAIPF